MLETKAAVASGYWFNFRYNPELVAEGKNPFILDSKEPTASYLDFIKSETRYSSLEKAFPERAGSLFSSAEQQAKDKYAALKKKAEN
jgi:pyruvate-ferredoxin/flavodoxin oxidoreductase